MTTSTNSHITEYAQALHAAEAAGAPNPRACADRFLQGRELRESMSKATAVEELKAARGAE
jgi:non-canonical (house-cleaning) NTP pyrophosphatase